MYIRTYDNHPINKEYRLMTIFIILCDGAPSCVFHFPNLKSLLMSWDFRMSTSTFSLPEV